MKSLNQYISEGLISNVKSLVNKLKDKSNLQNLFFKYKGWQGHGRNNMCSGYSTAAILYDMGYKKVHHGDLFNQYFDNWKKNHTNKDLENKLVDFIKITSNKYKGSDTVNKSDAQKIRHKINSIYKGERGQLSSKELQNLPGATTTPSDVITGKPIKNFDKTIYFNVNQLKKCAIDRIENNKEAITLIDTLGNIENKNLEANKDLYSLNLTNNNLETILKNDNKYKYFLTFASFHWIALKKEIINNKTVIIGYNSQNEKNNMSDLTIVKDNNIKIGNSSLLTWCGAIIGISKK